MLIPTVLIEKSDVKKMSIIQDAKEKLGEDNLNLIIQEILTSIDGISLNTNEVLSAIKREKTLKHRHEVEGVPKGRPNKVDEAFENWKELKKAGKDQEAEDAVDNFKKNFGTTSFWKLQKKINHYLEKQGPLFGN